MDFFALKGKAIAAALALLGQPTSVEQMPTGHEQAQYRFDYADPEYVVFLFERQKRVERVTLVKKSDWPGWSGHSKKAK